MRNQRNCSFSGQGGVCSFIQSCASVVAVKKLFSILFIVGVFLILPGLCAAGLLSHSCICGESEECTHEELCAQDPCAKLTTRATVGDQSKTCHAALATPAATVSAVETVPSVFQARSATPSRSLRDTNLPVLPADLPLLI